MGVPREREAVMSGHGYYNQHSVLQAAAAELGLAALRAAARDVPIRDAPQPLVVADYGCSQGQNSLVPMGAAVQTLRARTDLPITVVHTDLPDNDFSSVFEVVAHDPASYAVIDDHAYALAAGRSFYDEILSPGMVALGWSSITTHWLSSRPCAVPGHLSAQLSTDPAVQARFADVAAADWAGFLAARAAELCPGGRVVMVEPALHRDGTIGSEPMLALMDEVLGELVADGRVTPQQAADATLPMWMRSADEYGRPIDAAPGLELVDLQLVESAPSPLWVAFEQDRDPGAYAAASVASMRAWSGAMLAEGIADATTLDAFYERCRVLGTQDPERLHLRTFHVVLDIRRT